jgi:NitT/TauT family transport system permease protein/taurine transport system permease protein
MLIACGAGILVGALVGGVAMLRNLMLPVFLQPLCRADRDPLSDLHRLVRHRLGIQDRLRRLYGFFPVMLSTAAGIRTIDPQYLLARAAWARRCRSRSRA